jgi:NodT family efflux transporter outer membrane factor (OMF) lipoprotein
MRKNIDISKYAYLNRKYKMIFFPILLIFNGCNAVQQADRSQFIESPKIKKSIAKASLSITKEPSNWPRKDWWKDFNSKKLDQLIDKALADNQNLKKAYHTLDESEAMIRVAEARLVPTLQSDFFFRQSRVPYRGVVYSYNQGQGGLYKTSGFITPFVMNWEIDFWGKNRASLQAALGDAEAQRAEMEQVRLLLSTSLSRAYLRGSALAKQLTISNEITKTRKKMTLVSELRYKSGIDTYDGVAAAQANEDMAIRREIATEAALGLQKDSIARLVGEGPDIGLDLFSSSTNWSLTQPSIPKVLPIELLRHRPDLAAALARAEAASERIHIAKTLFLPSLDLSIVAGLEGVSTTTTNLSQLSQRIFNSQATGFAAVPGLRLPIFQGGRLAGNLDAQRADYDQTVDSYNETLLQATQQVADAIINLRRSDKEFKIQQDFVSANEKQLYLANMRIEGGLRDHREMLQERVDVLEAEFSKENLNGERLVATVDLFQSLGGGYDNGPDSQSSKPTPELDPITPVSDTIRNITGG